MNKNITETTIPLPNVIGGIAIHYDPRTVSADLMARFAYEIEFGAARAVLDAIYADVQRTHAVVRV